MFDTSIIQATIQETRVYTIYTTRPHFQRYFQYKSIWSRTPDQLDTVLVVPGMRNASYPIAIASSFNTYTYDIDMVQDSGSYPNISYTQLLLIPYIRKTYPPTRIQKGGPTPPTTCLMTRIMRYKERKRKLHASTVLWLSHALY